MSQKTLADVFIKTLTEMWKAERESRLVSQRLQSRLRTERFLGAFSRAKAGHGPHQGSHHGSHHGHSFGHPAE